MFRSLSQLEGRRFSEFICTGVHELLLFGCSGGWCCILLWYGWVAVWLPAAAHGSAVVRGDSEEEEEEDQGDGLELRLEEPETEKEEEDEEPAPRTLPTATDDVATPLDVFAASETELESSSPPFVVSPCHGLPGTNSAMSSCGTAPINAGTVVALAARTPPLADPSFDPETTFSGLTP